MCISIDMCWSVLRKYYELSDATPAYAASLLLHPSFRLSYVKKNWQGSWVEPTLEQVRSLWQAYKNPLQPPAPGDYSVRSSDRMPNRWELIKASLKVCAPRAAKEDDELEAFIHGEAFPIDCSGLEWWCRETSRREYPGLFQFALDIMSIPSMADENERVFSGGRRTLRYDRSRLSPKYVEATECLCNWLDRKLIGNVYGLDPPETAIPELSAGAADC